jgi:hypothetical protein
MQPFEARVAEDERLVSFGDSEQSMANVHVVTSAVQYVDWDTKFQLPTISVHTV